MRASPYPIPAINRSSVVARVSKGGVDGSERGEGARPGKEDDWVRDINGLLQYNATFRSKALLMHNR